MDVEAIWLGVAVAVGETVGCGSLVGDGTAAVADGEGVTAAAKSPSSEAPRLMMTAVRTAASPKSATRPAITRVLWFMTGASAYRSRPRPPRPVCRNRQQPGTRRGQSDRRVVGSAFVFARPSPRCDLVPGEQGLSKCRHMLLVCKRDISRRQGLPLEGSPQYDQCSRRTAIGLAAAGGAVSWDELVHEGDEPRVVRGFENMGHLVNNDIFDAVEWLFGQFCVQADRGPGVVAGTPPCSHPLDEKRGGSGIESAVRGATEADRPPETGKWLRGCPEP